MARAMERRGFVVSTADSVALTRTFVYPTIGGATRWAHIGPQPVGVGGTDQNTHSQSTVQLVATAQGPLDFRLLDHSLSDAVLSYATIPMQANSVARLALTDASTVRRLEVDLDGDGKTDFYYLPGGTVLDVPETGARTASASSIIAVRPNPFQDVARIYYRLQAAGQVGFAVYDVSGRRRLDLDGGFHAAGVHSQTWDGRDATGTRLPPGSYFVRLRTATTISATRAILER